MMVFVGPSEMKASHLYPQELQPILGVQSPLRINQVMQYIPAIKKSQKVMLI